MNTQAFVAYSSRSAATKGAARKGHTGAVVQLDSPEDANHGKWGFYPVQADEPADAMSEDAAELEITPKRVEPEETPMDNESDASNGALAAAIEAGIESGETEPEETPIVQDAFGAFASAQLGAQQPAADPVRTQAVIRVEKNREERNGVKRPSHGTACANVWDLAFTLSDMSESTQGQHERIATLSQVVKAAEAAGVNKFTARTQYARWRVFHGLTGRLVQK